MWNMKDSRTTTHRATHREREPSRISILPSLINNSILAGSSALWIPNHPTETLQGAWRWFTYLSQTMMMQLADHWYFCMDAYWINFNIDKKSKEFGISGRQCVHSCPDRYLKPVTLPVVSVQPDTYSGCHHSSSTLAMSLDSVVVYLHRFFSHTKESVFYSFVSICCTFFTKPSEIKFTLFLEIMFYCNEAILKYLATLPCAVLYRLFLRWQGSYCSVRSMSWWKTAWGCLKNV